MNLGPEDEAYEAYANLLASHDAWQGDANHRDVLLKEYEKLFEKSKGLLNTKLPSRDWAERKGVAKGSPFAWLLEEEEGSFARFFSKDERDRLVAEAKKPLSWRASTFVDLVFYDRTKSRHLDSLRPSLTQLLLCWASQLYFDSKPGRNKGAPQFRVLKGFNCEKFAYESDPVDVSTEDVGVYAKLCYLTFMPLKLSYLTGRPDGAPYVPTSPFDWNRFQLESEDLIATLNRVMGTLELQNLIGSKWVGMCKEAQVGTLMSSISPEDLSTFGYSPAASYRNAMVCFRRCWNPNVDEVSARHASLVISRLFPYDYYPIEGYTEPLVVDASNTDVSSLYLAASSHSLLKRTLDFRLRRKAYAHVAKDKDEETTINPALVRSPIDENADLTTDEDVLSLVTWQVLYLVTDPDSYWTRLELSDNSTIAYETKKGEQTKVSVAQYGNISADRKRLTVSDIAKGSAMYDKKDLSAEAEVRRFKAIVVLWFTKMGGKLNLEEESGNKASGFNIDPIDVERCEGSPITKTRSEGLYESSAVASLFRFMGAKSSNPPCISVVYRVEKLPEEFKTGVIATLKKWLVPETKTDLALQIARLAVFAGNVAGVPYSRAAGIALTGFTLYNNVAKQKKGKK